MSKNEEVNLMKMMTYWRMTMVIRAKGKLIGMTLVEQQTTVDKHSRQEMDSRWIVREIVIK